MGNRIQKKLYFNNYFKLYEDTDITVKELKDKLYADKTLQESLGITDEMVDGFWEALMDGAYDPKEKVIRSYSYVLY
jgi:hypothetical protein